MRKLLIIFSLIFIQFGGCTNDQEVKEIMYVGTHSDQGLFVYEFHRKTGQFTELQQISVRGRPGFQALHPEGSYLYSVSGSPFNTETNHGTITAYKIDPLTGMLKLINEQSVEGRGPAHVSIDPQGRFAYVSNFGSGNLSVLAINDEGSLNKAVDVVQHEGSSIDPRRQTGPRVHATDPSNDGRFIYVSDMGIDKVMIYEVDQQTGKLTPAAIPYVESIPGSGPRHFTFHPNGDFAYSLEQMGSTIAVYSVDHDNGALILRQRINMLPDGFEEDNQASDIHITKDEKFLYASNRGHDSLVIYRINELTGKLILVGHEYTGRHPRNFMVDREGEFVFVANMDDDNIVVFRRDEMTGELNYSGNQLFIPTGTCITQHFLK